MTIFVGFEKSEDPVVANPLEIADELQEAEAVGDLVVIVVVVQQRRDVVVALDGETEVLDLRL